MNATAGPDDAVVVGVVGKPLGVRGEVYVHPDPDLEHDFAAGSVYDLPDGRTLTVEATRLHGNRRVVRFAEAADREAAEDLRGTVLTIARRDVELAEGAYWAADIVGREVREAGGGLVGVVESTLDGAAHDYLVVARPDGGEVLVPVVPELVDVTDAGVVVHAIPGLLDEP